MSTKKLKKEPPESCGRRASFARKDRAAPISARGEAGKDGMKLSLGWLRLVTFPVAVGREQPLLACPRQSRDCGTKAGCDRRDYSLIQALLRIKRASHHVSFIGTWHH